MPIIYHSLFLVLMIVTVITCINSIYPHEQILQHAGAILLMIPLLNDLFKDKLPFSAFVGIILFTILHVIGARYMYSYVPYKEWAISWGIVDAGYFQDTYVPTLIMVFDYPILFISPFLFLCNLDISICGDQSHCIDGI